MIPDTSLMTFCIFLFFSLKILFYSILFEDFILFIESSLWPQCSENLEEHFKKKNTKVQKTKFGTKLSNCLE